MHGAADEVQHGREGKLETHLLAHMGDLCQQGRLLGLGDGQLLALDDVLEKRQGTGQIPLPPDDVVGISGSEGLGERFLVIPVGDEDHR